MNFLCIYLGEKGGGGARAGPIPPWTDPIRITILASRYDTYHDTFIYRRLVVKMNRFIPRTAQKGK